MSEKLREYQLNIINETFYSLEKSYSSVLLQMPTGTGKTHVFAEIVRRWIRVYEPNKRVLILAHRIELIDQILERLLRFGIKGAPISSKKVMNVESQVQVAMVQSLRNPNKLPKNISLLVIDEAHHTPAQTYISLINHYKKTNPRIKIIGLTATPWRLSGAGFSEIFNHLITAPQIKTFINNGFLVPLKHYAASIIDLNSIKVDKSKKEYDERELEVVVRGDLLLAELIESYKKYANNKKTIVFALNRAHSEDIVNRFRKEGITAEFIDANTNSDERKKIVDQFRKGDIQVLSNVNIFTEGFDCPDVEVVQLARPTKSLSLYLQQVGRAMRPSENKDYGIIIDNACLWEEHGLATQPFSWSLDYDNTEESIQIEKRKKRIKDKIASLPTEVIGVELSEILDFDFEEKLEEENEIYDHLSKSDLGTKIIEDFKYIVFNNPEIIEIDNRVLYQHYFNFNKSIVFYYASQEELEETIERYSDEEDDLSDIDCEVKGQNLELHTVWKRKGIYDSILKKYLIPVEYDVIEKPNLFGFSIISKNQKNGIFDWNNFKILFDCKYDLIKHSNDFKFQNNFFIQKDGFYSIFDIRKNIETDSVFDAVEIYNDHLNVVKDDRWHILDDKLNVVHDDNYLKLSKLGDYDVIKYNDVLSIGFIFPFIFEKIEAFNKNSFLVYINSKGFVPEKNVGLLNLELEWLIDPKHRKIEKIKNYYLGSGLSGNVLYDAHFEIVVDGFNKIELKKDLIFVRNSNNWSVLVENDLKYSESTLQKALNRYSQEYSNRNTFVPNPKTKNQFIKSKALSQSEIKKKLRSIYQALRSIEIENDVYEKPHKVAFELKTTRTKLENIIIIGGLNPNQINLNKIGKRELDFFRQAIEFLNSSEIKY